MVSAISSIMESVTWSRVWQPGPRIFCFFFKVEPAPENFCTGKYYRYQYRKNLLSIQSTRIGTRKICTGTGTGIFLPKVSTSPSTWKNFGYRHTHDIGHGFLHGVGHGVSRRSQNSIVASRDENVKSFTRTNINKPDFTPRKARKSQHFWHFKPTKQNLWGFLWWINMDKLSIYCSLSFDLKLFAHIFPKMDCYC